MSSTLPLASSMIASLFLLKIKSVVQTKPPRSIFVVPKVSSIPWLRVCPILVVNPPKPVEVGKGCGANKSVVLVSYTSKVPETLLPNKLKSKPALAVVEFSHLRSGFPIEPGLYP